MRCALILGFFMFACISDDAAIKPIGSSSGGTMDGGSAGPKDAGGDNADAEACTPGPSPACCQEWNGEATIVPFSARGTGVWHDFGARPWKNPNAEVGQSWVLFARAADQSSNPTMIFAVNASDPMAVPMPIGLEDVFQTTSMGWPAPFPDGDAMVFNSGAPATGNRNQFKMSFNKTTDKWKQATKAMSNVGPPDEASDAQVWPDPGGGGPWLLYSYYASPDRRSIYSARLNSGGAFDDARSEVVLPKIAGPSGTLNVGAPFLSPDGKKLYFSAFSSPTNPIDADIYVATRAGATGNFTAVSKVDELSNPIAADFPSYVSPDGCRFLFTSNRTPGDIFRVFQHEKRRPK
jgi:hypothetical protein